MKLELINWKNLRRYLSCIIFIILAFSFVLPKDSVAVDGVSHNSDASRSAEVIYNLPYPGLLPDHPLYFLKAARDKIVSFFISSPIKKSEYDLLQADKRIAASVFLAEKGDVELAQSTFSKAENYFEKALAQAESAKMQGMHTGEIANKLREANLKHQQVLDNMMENLEQDEQELFLNELERLEGFEQKAKEILPEK